MLNKQYTSQQRSITRRTLGEFACLQNMIENEVNDIYNMHFKALFKTFDEFNDEYQEAMKKYEFLDDEIRQRNLAEGRSIEIHNLSDYNDDYKLHENKDIINNKIAL